MIAWAILIAIGVWWTANTVSHLFIHRPFFRSHAANAVFSAGLSAVLGFPQSLWRERHLAHHAGRDPHMRWSAQLAMEWAIVAAAWSAIAATDPRWFAFVYVPGYAAGLTLCAMQGHYEHAGGVTSHYGRLYNLLLFNDGFHAEHHARPGVCWRDLPQYVAAGARNSRWPALLRWLDAISLVGLERAILRWPSAQARVLKWHSKALRKLISDARRIVIVGGGLFPRSAIALAELLPAARITILDASAESLNVAMRLLPGSVECARAKFIAGEQLDCDLAVIPLSFDGDRNRVYQCPPARLTLVHEWIWRPRGRTAIVSWLLLKRINLVER